MRRKLNIESGTRAGGMLRYPRRAKRHFAGGQAGHFHRGRHAVLHASALLGVRQDDRQRGHPPVWCTSRVTRTSSRWKFSTRPVMKLEQFNEPLD